jgi:hypothetical protein
MNVSVDIAHKVVDSLRSTPFVLIILLINTIALAGFAYALHEVGDAAERRDTILAKCIK